MKNISIVPFANFKVLLVMSNLLKVEKKIYS